MTRTSIPRKAKQSTIATTRVMAIFTIVQRRSSRCSRNGFDVSLSGNSRNRKTSRSAISIDADDFAREQSRPGAQGVGVTDNALGDHVGDFLCAKFAAFDNGFSLGVGLSKRSPLHWVGEKEKLVLVSETGRRKKIAEKNGVAAPCQFVAGPFA